jgi:hypothetical protein
VSGTGGRRAARIAAAALVAVLGGCSWLFGGVSKYQTMRDPQTGDEVTCAGYFKSGEDAAKTNACVAWYTEKGYVEE